MIAVLRWIFLVLSVSLSALMCFPQSAPDKQAGFAAHVQKAQQYLDEKRPDLAIPELHAAAEINPGNVEIQGNLGVLLYFQGKLRDALPHLRAAVKGQPGLAKIQGLLGLAEVRTLDLTQGKKDLEAAFPVITDPKFKVEVGLELVSLDTQGSDLEAASVIVAELRKMAPDNPEVLYAAYRTYADLSGESMLALSLSAPDSAQMHQLLAHEETREGDTAAALAEFRRAISLNPHLPGIHFELAELLRASPDAALKKQAEQEYRAALLENPHDEKAVLRLADIDWERGNIQRSYEEYTKAIELDPSDADAKLGLAKTLIERNQTDKALTLLEEAVRLEPTNATAHYRLAVVYRDLRREEDAKREIELFKKYKEMKEKLRILYKDLQLHPEEAKEDGEEPK